MAPVSAAEKAALDAFFKGKRGERVLIEHPPARGLGYGPTRWTWVRSETVCVCACACLFVRACPTGAPSLGVRRASSYQRIRLSLVPAGCCVMTCTHTCARTCRAAGRRLCWVTPWLLPIYTGVFTMLTITVSTVEPCHYRRGVSGSVRGKE